MKPARRFTAAILACATMLALNAPAAAAPLTAADIGSRSSVAGDGIQNVQWRHRHHGPHWRHGHWRHRNYGWGPTIGGLAAGAIIGGAIANSQARARADEVAYCSQRFKSYDPASGTYLGYNGMRHACP